MLARVLAAAALAAGTVAHAPIDVASNLVADAVNHKHMTPEDVYHSTNLDRTIRVGSEAHKGWANPLDNGGSMMDVRTC